MKHIMLSLMALVVTVCATSAANKTLVVYYSYTNNCKQIAETLTSQISADILRVEPAEKGVDYAANGYAIGSSMVDAIRRAPTDANSYPAIDPVTVSLTDYANVIIVTPLWWSQMAAPMQSFLFRYGNQLTGKNIGLVISSHSSGPSEVEADCKRLVPTSVCEYLSKSLWINANGHANRASLVAQWLKDTNFSGLNTTNMGYINITIDGKTISCTLANNTSATALVERLTQGAITYEAHDYGNFEKVGNIGFSLPQNDESIATTAGDVILYDGTNICIYYDENLWSFTRIGKIEGMTQSEIKSFVNAGGGNVMATLSLPSATVTRRAIGGTESNGAFALSGQRLTGAPTRGLYAEGGKLKANR